MTNAETAHPYELIAKVLEDVDSAHAVLAALKNQARQGNLRLFNAAALAKTHAGIARVEEIQDVKAGKGAWAGALTGALVGLLGGPGGVIVGALAGAATGGAVAGKLDLGFEDDFLADLQQSLAPGTSLLLVVVEQPWTEQAVAALEELPGRLFRQAIRTQLVEQLKQAGVS